MSHDSKQPSLLEELKRRRVFRVAILYCVVGWLLIQIGEATFEPLGLPDGSLRLVIILVILGLPIAIAMGWVFDVTPEGVVRTSSDPDEGETRIPVHHRMTLIIVLAALLAVGISVWRPDRLPEPVAPTTGSELRADPTSPSARFLHPPLPDKPSIVVLPFDNRGLGPLRHCPELGVRLQGAGRRRQAGRKRAGCSLRPRGKRPEELGPPPGHGPADRRALGLPRLERELQPRRR
jgi:hypothetical protein